jgi:hypothetical protein
MISLDAKCVKYGVPPLAYCGASLGLSPIEPIMFHDRKTGQPTVHPKLAAGSDIPALFGPLLA